jgi:hypothetical protein
MASIIIPSRWNRQPTYPAALCADGIADGITGAFSVFGGVARLGSALPTTQSGVVTPGFHGMGVKYSGAQKTQFGYGTIPPLVGRYTLAFLFSLKTLSNYSGLFSYQPGTTLSGIEIRLGVAPTGSELFWKQGTVSGYNHFTIASGSFVANSARVALVLASTGYVEDIPTVVLNGSARSVTKVNTNTGAVALSGTPEICFGSRTDGTTFLDGTLFQAVAWNRMLSVDEAIEWCAAPWQIYQPINRRIYFDVGGGATARTATGSLDSAVQYSRTATASIDSAIQVGLTGTVSLSAAISQALTATASLEAAIQSARTASASVDAMITAGTTASTSLDAALQIARTASATLDAAVQIARTASASVDGAVQRALTASASLDGYVQAGTTALASLDAAIQYARTGTASLDAALSIARTASASLDADIVVSSAGTVTASLDAALAIVVTATASLDAAIRHARTAVASLDGYVYDSSATEAEGYTFKASARAPFRASRRVVH